MKNGYVERFNRTYREEVLDMYIFDNIHHVRELTEGFMDDYNHKHPHKSIGNKAPIGFMNERKEKSLFLL